jgi:hypothetical protein
MSMDMLIDKNIMLLETLQRSIEFERDRLPLFSKTRLAYSRAITHINLARTELSEITNEDSHRDSSNPVRPDEADPIES